jgi:hypothetical protein
VRTHVRVWERRNKSRQDVPEPITDDQRGWLARSVSMPVDVYVCLVFTGQFVRTGAVNQSWSPGPLPLAIPVTDATQLRGWRAALTNREGRQGYFAERVLSALYGPQTADDASTTRWHTLVEPSDASVGGAVVDAWEVLEGLGDGNCLAIAHVQLAEDPARTLAALTAGRGPGRAWIESTLPAPVVLQDQRPRVVAHLMWEGSGLTEPLETPEVRDVLGRWSTAERWQWFLASGLAPEDVLPDPEAPDIVDGRIRLSRDWRALVLRDGIAYVAQTPRVAVDSRKSNSFHDVARIYVRSIHLDVLLLGLIQVGAVRRYADAVARLRVDKMDPAAIESLEERLLDLRLGVWWDDVTNRGRQTSEVLTAFQRQHRLPELYTKIVENLSDASRYIAAREAAVSEAERRAKEDREQADEVARREEETRRHEFDRAIALISFILLPASVIFSGAALWADPSRRLFVVSLGLSGLLIGIFLFASPTLRAALRGHSGRGGKH